MSTTTTIAPSASSVQFRPTLWALARADMVRFARHPLFIFGALVAIAMPIIDFITGASSSSDPVSMTVGTAFFVGVFGFVVAHRLTTSMRRANELVGTLPTAQRRRTWSLLLACVVPAAIGLLWAVMVLTLYAFTPPKTDPPGGHLAWFGDEPALAVVAAMIAGAPLACLGGPLLGVAVARWAPFRGSAVLGTVVLVVGTSLPTELDTPWRVLPPFATLTDEVYDSGRVEAAWLVPSISPVWYCLYLACLCGLAVVAALLRDPIGRGRLLLVGGALGVAAAGCFVLTVA